MLLYSLLQDQEIKCLYLAFAHLGPSKMENEIVFNTQEFGNSILDYLRDIESKEKKSKLSIEIIIA